MAGKRDLARDGGLFEPREPEAAHGSQGSPALATRAPRAPLTVSALLHHLRDTLEHRFPMLDVVGEISNLTLARSGHLYFVLKDATGQIRCVMFRNRTAYLARPPREGERVEVRGAIGIYEARGDLQLNIESMRAAGAGALFEAFVALRDRLAAEGLFDEAAKRAPPALPHCVGVITSPQGAALRDVLSTLARRNPAVRVIVYPTQVQGASAAAEITRALRIAERRRECDVLLLARGGGSIEDLWAFNDEALARAIRASSIPIVTGIGHQTDFTIADFAADVRAATPTAAAELLSPPRHALLARVGECVHRLHRRVRYALEARMQQLDTVVRRLAHPRDRLLAQSQRVRHAIGRLGAGTRTSLLRGNDRLTNLAGRQARALPALAPLRVESEALAMRSRAAVHATLEQNRVRLATARRALAHLDPRAVLARGYSIATDVDGRVLRSAAQVGVGASIAVRLADGVLGAEVTSKR